MYKKAFDDLLKKSLPRAVFLYGDCDFLIDFYGNKLRNLIKQKGEVEEYLFYFDEYNFEQISLSLSQQSLFSAINLIVLKLNKIKSSKKSSDMGEFLKILDKNENSYFIVEYHNDGDRSYTKNAEAQAKYFNKNYSCAVRFFNPNTNEAMEILNQFALELNLKISRGALSKLCEIENNRVELCVNELRKLALLNREIGANDVDALSFGLSTNTTEELCEALFDKNKDRYLNVMLNLENEGILMVDLISEMQRYFYRLFLFYASIKANGERDSRNILGYKLPPKIEEKYIIYAMRLREREFLEIFKILSEWRLAAISGKEKNYFTNLIKIQALIK